MVENSRVIFAFIRLRFPKKIVDHEFQSLPIHIYCLKRSRIIIWEKMPASNQTDEK